MCCLGRRGCTRLKLCQVVMLEFLRQLSFFVVAFRSCSGIFVIGKCCIITCTFDRLVQLMLAYVSAISSVLLSSAGAFFPSVALFLL